MPSTLHPSDIRRALLFGLAAAAGALLGSLGGDNFLPRDAGQGTFVEILFNSMISTGIWNAMLAAGLAGAIAIAESQFRNRSLPSGAMLSRAIVGGLITGALAGACAEFVFKLNYLLPIPPEHRFFAEEGARIVAWILLGALTAVGISRFLPNLPATRAMIGGGIGGGLGSLGFIAAAAVAGSLAGRMIGVPIVGFGIGVMIAAADILLREAWLEVQYGPREVRRVTLGSKPILLGSDRVLCTVLLPRAASVAAEYRLDGGNVIFQNHERGTTESVAPGHRHLIGGVQVVVQGQGRSGAAMPPPLPKPMAGGLLLRVGSRRVPLTIGVRLAATDLPGCVTNGETCVAEVVANPQQPNILGLKNHTRRGWSARTASGEVREIATGQSIRLAAGVRIQMGGCEATVESA